MGLLAAVSKSASSCQQSCKQLPATLQAAASNRIKQYLSTARTTCYGRMNSMLWLQMLYVSGAENA